MNACCAKPDNSSKGTDVWEGVGGKSLKFFFVLFGKEISTSM